MAVAVSPGPTREQPLHHSRRVRAFTLIEALLVLAIIAVLMGITLPMLRGTRDSARLTACLVNLKSLYTGTLSFGLERNSFPLGSRRGDVRTGAVSLALDLQGHIDAAVPTTEKSGMPRSGAPYTCPSDRTDAPLTGFSYEYEIALRLVEPEWRWDTLHAPTDRARAESVWKSRADLPNGIWYVETAAHHSQEPAPLVATGDGYVGPFARGK